MTTKPMHPRKRLVRIARESEQLVRDITWWNQNRTDAPPMDCGRDRVRGSLARKAIAAWDANDKEAYRKCCDALYAHCDAEQESEAQ